MLYQRAASALSSSERQLLRTQWTKSEQCARCFHASAQRRAGASSNGSSSAAPPERRSSRRERSARISNEVSQLQKSPASVPTASKGSTAASTSSRVSEPNEGGKPTPTATHPVSEIRSSNSSRQESSLRERLSNIKPLGVPFKPSVPASAAEFLRSGYGTSTPAANNFAGIITDRIACLTGTIGRRTPRTAEERYQRRDQGLLTQLTAEDIAIENSTRGRSNFRLRLSLKKQLIGKLVQGKYKGYGGLEGKAANGTVLGKLRKQLVKNESFLKRDVDTVVGRVRAFMDKAQWSEVQAENGLRQGEM